ncbi:hypothetical protein GOP47_0027265 [Adiantum capillus-veneris]|nr:hypothetical protein GOP47_0027265 [Adiantum capillus-veneris]
MADDSEPSNRFYARRYQRPVICQGDNLSGEASSSLSDNPEHEQSSDESCFYTNDLLNMDYFAAPSKGFLVQQEIGDSVIASTASLEADDDSSSRSCSSDSRESCGEHCVREKDADPYIGDYAIVLHDMPMDAIQESHGDVSGVIDDRGGGNDAPWKSYLGAWISEAGRSSNFYSIALAAAVIGLVLFGSGWDRIRLQFQKFRCRYSYNGKGLSQAMYQLVHVKGSSSKLRRIPVAKAQSCFSGV